MTLNSDAAQRELGAGLRALRQARGLTVRGLAELVDGLSAANVSHYENGARLMPEERLDAIVAACAAPADERERLLGLRRQAEQAPGELVGGAATIGPRLARLIEQEQTASEIVEVALGVVPGLLQTRGYARAVLAGEEAVDTLVTLRMGRREILRGSDPARLRALIDTEVLVRPVAPPAVMAEQLRHLLEIAALPNVTLQLVPSTAAGFSPHLIGSFTALRFPRASAVIHVEAWSASAVIWEQQDVDRFLAAVEMIEKRAMTPERTAEVIAEMVRGLETR